MNTKPPVRLATAALFALALAGGVFAQDSITGLTVAAGTVLGGEAAEGIVTLASPAPAGGWKVNLLSENASVQVPASIIVPAGHSEYAFLVNTDPNLASYTNVIAAGDVNSIQIAVVNIEAPAPVIQILQGAANLTYDPVHQVLIAVPGGVAGAHPPFGFGSMHLRDQLPQGSPDDQRPAGTGLLIINPSDGDIARTISLPASALGATMSADNSHLLVACGDGAVRILNPSTYGIEATATIPGSNIIDVLPVPGTSESFVVCNGTTTYIFDGAVQRPNAANLGIVEAISQDGLHFVGGDYRYSPSSYSVASINAQGFYDQTSAGYGPVTPNITYADNHPVNGDGVVLDPLTGAYVTTLPFVVSGDRQLTGFPDGINLVSLSWDPDVVQVTNMATLTSTGTLTLPQTDGGLGPVFYAGHHRIAYFTYGYISDYQIIIVTNPLFP